jgi:hypothetical protein
LQQPQFGSFQTSIKGFFPLVVVGPWAKAAGSHAAHTEPARLIKASRLCMKDLLKSEL